MLTDTNRQDGVSPVVAVILLVAVTVTLSAVIGGFALNFGQSATGGSPQTGVGVTVQGNDSTVAVQAVSIGDADRVAVKYGNKTKNITSTGGYATFNRLNTSESVTVIAVTDGERSVVSSRSADAITTSTSTTVSGPFTVDTFEDMDASEYNHSTKGGVLKFETSLVKEGNVSARTPFNNNVSSVYSTNGLDTYPDRGDTFTVWARESSNYTGNIHVHFAYNASTGDKYSAWANSRQDKICLHNGTKTCNAVTVNNGTWYKFKVDWNTSTITYTLISESGTELQSVTINDTQYDTGGIGIGAGYYDATGEGYFDDFKITADDGNDA